MPRGSPGDAKHRPVTRGQWRASSVSKDEANELKIFWLSWSGMNFD